MLLLGIKAFNKMQNYNFMRKAKRSSSLGIPLPLKCRCFDAASTPRRSSSREAARPTCNGTYFSFILHCALELFDNDAQQEVNLARSMRNGTNNMIPDQEFIKPSPVGSSPSALDFCGIMLGAVKARSQDSMVNPSSVVSARHVRESVHRGLVRLN
jgi:hypothetical protein